MTIKKKLYKQLDMIAMRVLWGLLLVSLLFSCSKQPEKLLLGGSGWNKIAIVDKASKQIEWEYPLERGWECNSVDVDTDGHILFSYSKGARLIDREKNTVWDVKAPEGCELQTAKALPGGRYLLAWCGTPAVILEVDKKGNTLSRTEYDTQIPKAHAQFRQVNKNKAGNYLMPLLATASVCEIDPNGQLLKSVKVKGGPFSVAVLSNGHYLVACGDKHSFVELDFETGKTIREVNADDIEGAKLFFVAQLLPTKPGGLYICNWQGHGKDAANHQHPQLIELDKKGQMIWSLNDNERFGMISAVCAF